MKDTFGSELKLIEANSLSITHVEGYRNFVVRLDGSNFSRFTSGLPKPYDKGFSQVMILTTNDLVEKFHAQTGYTHSDEITVIFKAACSKEDWDGNTPEKREHSRSGRVTKLLTLMASYTAVRFNYHYNLLVDKYAYSENTQKKIKSMHAMFDARILVFPYEKQRWFTVHHMVWRSMMDCPMNGVSTFADHYIGKKKTFGMDDKKKRVVMHKTGVDFSLVPEYYQHGLYVKKILVDKECEDPRTGEKLVVKRGVPINFTMQCSQSPDAFNACADVLLGKYLPEEHKHLTTPLDVSKIVNDEQPWLV